MKRILLLCHSFNSLTQRLHVELRKAGHEISVEFDIHDENTKEAVELFKPNAVIAPYLRRKIPDPVWQAYPCFVVHPGPPGDRGPAALDWAILKKEKSWGVTVFQANAQMDAGPIWASETFPLRLAPKSSLYRHEVTQAAIRCVFVALKRFFEGGYIPQSVKGHWQGAVRQEDRAISWKDDDTQTILKKIYSADSFPGVLDKIFGEEIYLYDASIDSYGYKGTPGEILGWHGEALCRATQDGAVWIGQMSCREKECRSLKLPATVCFQDQLKQIPQFKYGPDPIHLEVQKGVGYLHFTFYNGAMSTVHCQRLQAMVRLAQKDPRIQVLCLLGGRDFWSNGLHLNIIEASPSPADASWENICAMNDLVYEIITATNIITVAALEGNSAAGGCFLALAADYVVAQEGIILNPHYKNMGNLYGSEYWTYLLPRKIGAQNVSCVMSPRLPMGTADALKLGYLDHVFPTEDFLTELRHFAENLVSQAQKFTEKKHKMRKQDEAYKPLRAYCTQELEQLKINFWGFDPSYHIARHNFVYKISHSKTPLHLALHR